MILLYHRLTSGNSYKVRLLLSILRLEYEAVAVELESGRNKVDEPYLRLNPRGQIPTLVDDGFVLWGSTAILFYLARKYDAGQCWLPAEARPAAEVMQWLELAQNECNTGLFLARAIRRFGYSGDISAALRDGRKALDVLEGRLCDREWLVLQHATIADLACFPYAALASEGGFQPSDWPAVQRWIGRIRELEGFIGMPGIVGPETQSRADLG
jgi:glutathione S-transferase